MTINQRFEVPGTPEQVGDLLASEAFCLEGERVREGVVSAAYCVVEKSADAVTYEIRSVEHKRSMTGGMDKATIDTLNRSTWDRRRLDLSWSYKGQEADRIKVGGRYRFVPTGTGTRIEHDVTVDVNIPLVGGAVAKLIAKGFEAGFKGFEDRLRAALKK
jgi:hypothetical protein